LSIGGFKSGIIGYSTARALGQTGRAGIDRTCTIALFGMIFSKKPPDSLPSIFHAGFPLVKH
jgi:hypothetical protein